MDPWWDQHRPLRRPSVGGVVVDGDPHPRGPGARPTKQQMEELMSRQWCRDPPHWWITLRDEAEVRQEEIAMKWQSLAHRIIAMRNRHRALADYVTNICSPTEVGGPSIS